jgi:putative transposase
MKLRYRFRFYPTDEQAQELARVFGSVRYVYNWALRLRSDAYRDGHAKRIGYHESSAALTELKQREDHAWLNDVSSVPLQQSLRHLQTAFGNFFEKRAKYPKFKKKYGDQAADYASTAFKWDADNRNLTLAKVGRLDIHWSRTFKSTPTTVTVTKARSGRYFVTLVLDESIKPLPKTGESIGIDMGINRLATLSNGERIANPKHTNKYARKLARAQRALARKQQGSARRERARLRVAKIQAKIADTRQDSLHKTTTDLVRRFDVICIEDLNVRGMVKNHNLAKAISDASFGAFARQLEYKCEWYGKELVKVDRFFPSSKMCSTCGHICESMPLDVREWTCPECSTSHDRDENAAKNILAVGHIDSQNAQGGLRKSRGSSTTKGSARRDANQPSKH